MENFITGWTFSPVDRTEKKKRDYMGNFSLGWNWMWEREPLFFIFIVVHKGSTHVLMNFQPRLKFLVDYMGNFSPINRAENLIPGSSNRAEVFRPGNPGWNFLYVIANSVLQGFYRKPGMNFQPCQIAFSRLLKTMLTSALTRFQVL